MPSIVRETKHPRETMAKAMYFTFILYIICFFAVQKYTFFPIYWNYSILLQPKNRKNRQFQQAVEKIFFIFAEKSVILHPI